MSIDVAVDVADATVEEPDKSRRAGWYSDLRTVRIVRFAFGMTLIAGIAFGMQWPLYFVTPLIASVFLANTFPLATPVYREALKLILYSLVAFTFATVFTLTFIPYPIVYIILYALVLFHIYYALNRGAPFFFMLMSLIAIMLAPVIGMTYDEVVLLVEAYFAFSVVFAILLYAIVYGLLPDPPGCEQPAVPAGFHKGYSKPAALTAIKSTIAALPLALMFILLGLKSAVLMLILVAVFSAMPDLATGKYNGFKMIKATLMGGIAALLFFVFLQAVPEFYFFLTLWLLWSLVFGYAIFTDWSYAKYMGSAYIAFLVLVATSLEGVVVMDKFFLRLTLITGMAIYLVMAFSLLDHIWQRRFGEA